MKSVTKQHYLSGKLLNIVKITSGFSVQTLAISPTNFSVVIKDCSGFFELSIKIFKKCLCIVKAVKWARKCSVELYKNVVNKFPPCRILDSPILITRQFECLGKTFAMEPDSVRSQEGVCLEHFIKQFIGVKCPKCFDVHCFDIKTKD